MANPNIVSVSSIYGANLGWNLTGSLATLMTVSADKIIKINTILCANVDTTATVDIQVSGIGSGAGVTASGNDADVYIAKGITVPAGSTISVLEKPIYLMEGDILKGGASVANDIDLYISYEVIDDA
jgi:hypothetical protein